MIKMLTGSSCPACTMLKKRLDAEGLEYEPLDIEEPEGANLARSLGVRSIPVLVKMSDSGSIKVTETITGSSHPMEKYKEFFN